LKQDPETLQEAEPPAPDAEAASYGWVSCFL
jgi:hypothetical protein